MLTLRYLNVIFRIPQYLYRVSQQYMSFRRIYYYILFLGEHFACIYITKPYRYILHRYFVIYYKRTENYGGTNKNDVGNIPVVFSHSNFDGIYYFFKLFPYAIAYLHEKC